MLFEKALSSIGKENKELNERYEKGVAEYKKAKETYNKLPENQREKWLKENDWKAKDFADDVVGYDEELDNEKEIRYAKGNYSFRNPNTVTEKEYNHHYWAIANNLLSKEEIGILDDAIANIYTGDYYKNVNGLYMIPVGENGVLNKIVFTDGVFDSYSIDTVVEINSKDKDILSIERENIYARESNGIQTETKGLFKVYYSKTYRFSDYGRNGNGNLQNRNGKQDGARSDRKTSRAIKFSKETIDNNNSGNGVDVNEDLGQDLSEKEKSIAERAGATEVVTSPTDNASSLDSIHNTNENVNTSHERRKQITI